MKCCAAVLPWLLNGDEDHVFSSDTSSAFQIKCTLLGIGKKTCSAARSTVKRALVASAQTELRVLSPAAPLDTLNIEVLVNRALMVVSENV